MFRGKIRKTQASSTKGGRTRDKMNLDVSGLYSLLKVPLVGNIIGLLSSPSKFQQVYLFLTIKMKCNLQSY